MDWKMTTIVGQIYHRIHKLNKFFLIFFLSEPFDLKPGWNVHCMMLYQMHFLCVDWICKTWYFVMKPNYSEKYYLKR